MGKSLRAPKTVAILLGVALLSTSLSALAATRIPVLTRKRAGEFQPARGGGYLAWEQNTRALPNRFNVYARRDGGRRFKVNADHTGAAMGGISGNLLVYQQFRRGKSNIKFFNLQSRTRRSPQIYVNTPKWEYWPSLSGAWLLFGRRNASATKRTIILYNRSTQAVRVLDKTTTGSKAFISPGQVNGDWVVWHRCRPLPKCNVYRYNIRTKLTLRVPNPKNESQHAASVTSDGTVYFARGGGRCGRNVRLLRFPVGGPITWIGRLKKGRDAGDSYAITDATGANHFFFEQNVCGKAAVSDIYKYVD